MRFSVFSSFNSCKGSIVDALRSRTLLEPLFKVDDDLCLTGFSFFFVSPVGLETSADSSLRLAEASVFCITALGSFAAGFSLEPFVLRLTQLVFIFSTVYQQLNGLTLHRERSLRSSALAELPQLALARSYWQIDRSSSL